MSISVLIIDDSQTTRWFIEQALHAADPDVGTCHQASNGREALAILEQTWVDLIFLDLHMPEMNGRDLLRRIRANEMWHGIPVAVVTSERSDQTEFELSEMGATYYQKKPLTPEILRDILAALKEMMP